MLFIFDWDGTLSDSTAKITKAMQVAAIDLGWPVLADAQIHNIIGLGLPEAMSCLYPGRTAAEYHRLRDAYAGHFLALDQAQPSEFFPGVLGTLASLQQQGHILTVATGKSRKGLDRILAALGVADLFVASRCADETASKPHPLMLEQLLEAFAVPVSAAVMIGDTEYDMAMARAIDMPRIAVSYGAHHIDRLRPYEPELCLDEFEQLLAWSKLAGC